MLCTPLRPADCFFFFNDTATTEIYTLSLHDALPIYCTTRLVMLTLLCVLLQSLDAGAQAFATLYNFTERVSATQTRSEEHTSELQSQSNLVCRLLLEKKKISHRHMIF